LNILSLIRSWLKLRTAGHIPDAPIHWDREAYVPIHTVDLVNMLASKVVVRGQNEKHFRLLCKLILSVLHQRYRKRHENLTHIYAAIDPDRVAEVRSEVNDENRDELTEQLFDGIADVLERGNYRKLTPQQIELAASAASQWGVRLQIAFSKFCRLEVYARGDIIGKRWRTILFKRFETDVPIYQRLVLLFRTKNEQSLDERFDPDKVYLRMFKNIPKVDVDMILPGGKVRMNWIDRGKIGIPTVWGFFLFMSRLVRNATLLALLGIFNLFASAALIVVVILALIYYSVIHIFRYSTARQRYMLNVAQSLYYQNLDNNAGVLLRLLEEAEQQEACETIIGYFVLSDPSNRASMTIEEVDRQAEEVICGLCGINVDFDVNDAIRDLVGLGLVTVDERGWKGAPSKEGIAHLDQIWDKYFLVPESEFADSD